MSTNSRPKPPKPPKQPPPPVWEPEQINERLWITLEGEAKRLEGEAKLAEAHSPEKIVRWKCCTRVACLVVVLFALYCMPDLRTSILTVSGAIGWKSWLSKD